ncbi:uncharacterized protein LTR77_003626 [Saxophila tyrrhenica]|uniref:NAD dependent epimerase/dehydratase n=1 Tax=Saxophila tyrrhenica TaxID=1690608 RepID=A0AAV9PHN2_9PEZI|nr:hypothetical protein LTR77_003626 [Saxophila tyrrhenica]
MSALTAHPPQPGATVKILLGGPPYHLGVQTALCDSEQDVLTWIDVLKRRPYRDEDDRKAALQQMAAMLKGYVATADPPLSQLVPELLELYPDAMVICTVRDIDSWAASMEKIAAMVQPTLQMIIFFWIQNLRHLPTMWNLLPKIFEERYQSQASLTAEAKITWERHIKWLEEIVPKDRLFFADVRDGWEPLCRALDVPVPKDVPFPRLNDGKAFEEMFKAWAMQGLMRWAVFVGVCVAVVAGLVMWTR